MITRENYEEYIMMRVDGELPPVAVRELMQFLAENGLQGELEAYMGTKLVADTTVMFAGKNNLVKTPAKRMALPIWVRYSAAACVAAMLLIGAYRWVLTGSTHDVAKTTTVKELPKVSTATQEPKAAHTAALAVVAADTTKNTQVAAIAKTTIVKHNYQVIKPVPAVTNHVVKPNTIVKLNIDRVATTEVAKLSLPKPEIQLQATVSVPEYSVSVNEPETAARDDKRSFFDRLPIDELKKKTLKNIGESIANEIKNDPDEKALSIKIEKRKLLVSF